MHMAEVPSYNPDTYRLLGDTAITVSGLVVYTVITNVHCLSSTLMCNLEGNLYSFKSIYV